MKSETLAGMSSIQIKPATRHDVPVILSLIRELADYERLTHEVCATEENLEKALFDVPAAEAIVASCDDAVAGFALFFHNFSTFLSRRGLYLEDLYVRPVYRRRGVGQALLRYLARLAVDRQCGRFEWSVLDWNEPAQNFYRRLGATVLPDWRICRMTGDALQTLARSSTPS
jgi:GNAT superfamily N-acetyltransferase